VNKRDLLGLEGWSPEDYDRLLSLAARVKRGEVTGGLEGKVLAQLFLARDPRTQASVETAMYVHGGHATTLDFSTPGAAPETTPGARMDGSAQEHISDLARLACWADGVALRAGPIPGAWSEARTDVLLRSFADSCERPVLNLGSTRRNPCQALADSLALRERLGHPEGKRFVLTWSWDPEPLPTAIPASAALAAARLGMEIVIARPEGYELDPEDTALIRRTAQQRGGEFVHISDDLDDALVGADVVYVASWGSVKLHENPEEEASLRGQHRDWGLTRSRQRGTRGGRGVVMHAGPVRRNVAIDDQVLDGPDSAVRDQRDNLFHAHRSLLLELLNPGADR
jgi:N-acetylornithine carbamoyltransferase